MGLIIIKIDIKEGCQTIITALYGSCMFTAERNTKQQKKGNR